MENRIVFDIEVDSEATNKKEKNVIKITTNFLFTHFFEKFLKDNFVGYEKKSEIYVIHNIPNLSAQTKNSIDNFDSLIFTNELNVFKLGCEEKLLDSVYCLLIKYFSAICEKKYIIKYTSEIKNILNLLNDFEKNNILLRSIVKNKNLVLRLSKKGLIYVKDLDSLDSNYFTSCELLEIKKSLETYDRRTIKEILDEDFLPYLNETEKKYFALLQTERTCGNLIRKFREIKQDSQDTWRKYERKFRRIIHKDQIDSLIWNKFYVFRKNDYFMMKDEWTKLEKRFECSHFFVLWLLDLVQDGGIYCIYLKSWFWFEDYIQVITIFNDRIIYDKGLSEKFTHSYYLTHFLESLPEVINMKEADLLINKFISNAKLYVDYEQVKMLLDNIYFNYTTFYSKIKYSDKDLLELTLKIFYPDGIKTYNVHELNTLRKRAEKFCGLRIEVPDQKLSSIIVKNGYEIDEGLYALDYDYRINSYILNMIISFYKFPYTYDDYDDYEIDEESYALDCDYLDYDYKIDLRHLNIIISFCKSSTHKEFFKKYEKQLCEQQITTFQMLKLELKRILKISLYLKTRAVANYLILDE